MIHSEETGGLASPVRHPLSRRGSLRTAAFGEHGVRTDAVARAALKLRSLWGHTNYAKFVIVGTARTGSTLLIDLLTAHGQAVALGELFRTDAAIGWDVRPFASVRDQKTLALYQRDPVQFLRRDVFTRWPRDIAAVGFKLFYYHARNRPFSAVWDFLHDDPGIRIIHAKRRNILAQYLSLQLAHQTDIWSSKCNAAKPVPAIRLDPAKCREHFAQVQRYEVQAAEFFRRHPVRDLHYEDLVSDRDRELAAVQDFLGLERRPTVPTLVRQRRVPLSQAIENYGELRRAFADSSWSGFFNELE